MSGLEDLDEQIRRIRAIERVPEKAAPVVAEALDADLRANLGKSPDGEAWKPRLDGGAPLVNAGAALTVRAVGTTVVARVTGPTAKHDLGVARGRIRRQILPSGAMPQRMVAALKRAVLVLWQSSSR